VAAGFLPFLPDNPPSSLPGPQLSFSPVPTSPLFFLCSSLSPERDVSVERLVHKIFRSSISRHYFRREPTFPPTGPLLWKLFVGSSLFFCDRRDFSAVAFYLNCPSLFFPVLMAKDASFFSKISRFSLLFLLLNVQPPLCSVTRDTSPPETLWLLPTVKQLFRVEFLFFPQFLSPP